jgi:small nuclear ribonucleoprotein (snRNP)-like protein
MIVLTLHLRTEKVLVITQDGRTIVVRPSSSSPQLHTDEMEDVQGSLEGFDQTTNVILSDSTERVYSMDEGVEEVPLGLYVVRGDNIVRCSRPVCRGG